MARGLEQGKIEMVISLLDVLPDDLLKNQGFPHPMWRLYEQNICNDSHKDQIKSCCVGNDKSPVATAFFVQYLTLYLKLFKLKIHWPKFDKPAHLRNEQAF